MTQNYTTVVGESAATAAARAEIERLTKERDDYAWRYNEQCDTYSKMHVALEKAEAERDAIAAAALEAATSICADQFAAHMTAAIYGDPDNSRAREAAAAMAERLLHRIRALTPADAKAALESYGREKMRAGMKRAADIVLCHSDDRPRRYSMDWNDGYIDGCKGARDAILAEMEKLK